MFFYNVRLVVLKCIKIDAVHITILFDLLCGYSGVYKGPVETDSIIRTLVFVPYNNTALIAFPHLSLHLFL